MKRYRNRNRVLVLVMCFALIMVAGSAYAFTSQGPLTMVGIANINMDLRGQGSGTLSIRPSGAYNSDYDSISPVASFMDNGLGGISYWETHGTQGEVSLNYSLSGAQIVHFDVRNEGNVSVLITDVFTEVGDWAMWGFEVNTYLADPWSNQSLLGQILTPGDVVWLTIEVNFFPDFELWSYDMLHGSDDASATHITRILYEPLY